MFSCILLFTPSLGLLDTLHHGRLAALPVKNGQRIFTYSQDGVPITFSDAWQHLKIQDISDFPEIPMTVVLSIMIFTFLSHILASSGILKIKLGKKFSFGLMMQGFHSFIVPPLQFDWELFYRRDEENESVLNCWRRYFKSYIMYYYSIILTCHHIIPDQRLCFWHMCSCQQ